MYFEGKYGVQTTFRFSMVKRGVVDLAAAADWTPATGDTKRTLDGANVANASNNPVAVGGTGSVTWTLTLTAAEMTAAEINVQIVDSATKAVEDQFFTIYTYGNASAKFIEDRSLQPITPGTGTGQLSVTGGRADANQVAVGGYVYPTGTVQAATNTTATLASGTTQQQCCPGDRIAPTSGTGAGQWAYVASLDVTDPTHPVATLGPTSFQWPFVNLAAGTVYTIVKEGGGAPASLDEISPVVWTAVGVPRNLSDATNLTSDGTAIARESTAAAIKAKTDNVPAAPALESSVQAVKAKTDNLPSDPADQSLVIAATSAIAALIGAPVNGTLALDNVNLSGRIPDALVSGRLKALVAAVQNQAITAAAFATGAIDANALDATAVAEILAAVRAMPIESNGARTLQQVLSIMFANLAGITTDNGDTFKDPTGTAVRAAYTTDGFGNRLAATLTPST